MLFPRTSNSNSYFFLFLTDNFFNEHLCYLNDRLEMRTSRTTLWCFVNTVVSLVFVVDQFHLVERNGIGNTRFKDLGLLFGI